MKKILVTYALLNLAPVTAMRNTPSAEIVIRKNIQKNIDLIQQETDKEKREEMLRQIHDGNNFLRKRNLAAVVLPTFTQSQPLTKSQSASSTMMRQDENNKLTKHKKQRKHFRSTSQLVDKFIKKK